MDRFYYATIVIVCLSFLLIVFINSVVIRSKKKQKYPLIALVLASMLLNLNEAIWIIFIDGNSQISGFYNYCSNMCYYALIIFIVGIFFLYSETMQNSFIFNNKKLLGLFFIPLAAAVLLTITSFYTKWIFYIDDHNLYHRGPLMPYMISILMIYILFTCTKALILSFQKRNFGIKDDLLAIVKFCLFPIASVILAVIVERVPFIPAGISIGAMWVFVNQSSMISMFDPLTNLYNRRALAKILQKLFNDPTVNEFHVVMFDLDKFKSINDTYGHIEGDNAIIAFSEELIEHCHQYGGTYARYGGDEFIVIINRRNLDIEKFCQEFIERIKVRNEHENKPYKLKSSYGYVKYNHSYKNIPDLIEEADRMLYENKNKSKGV